MSNNDTAAYMGYSSNKSIRNWENNTKGPDTKNLPRLAKLYEVSIDAINEYDFIDLIDEICYQFNIEPGKFAGTAYNFNVQNGINEWLKIREKEKGMK